MIENFPHHYSMTNPATIYDEESLTVLELAGRLAYKLRELIADYNQTCVKVTMMDQLFDMVERLVVKPLGYATPQMFGAVGDGFADDTLAVQRALESLDEHAPVLYFPAGTYEVNADLVVPSNVTLRGQGTASIIRRAGNSLTHYAVLDLTLSCNVLIEDLWVMGDGGNHTGNSGEWGMGIKLGSSYDITVRGVSVSNCWGDGIYIGNSDDDDMCGNILIENCHLMSNRRNNISVIWVNGLRIHNCDIESATGTAPQAGIDFEPNSVSEDIYNAFVSDCRFWNNGSCDILIADGFGNDFDITISDCQFKSPVGFSYTGSLANADSAEYDVRVRNCDFINSFRCVSALHGTQTNRLIFRGCNFTCDKICVEIGESDLNSQLAVGNIHFWDCSVLGNGNYPIVRVFNTNGTCSGITGELNVLKSSTRYFSVSVGDYQGSDISLKLLNASTQIKSDITLSNTGMMSEVYIPDFVSVDPTITIGANWPTGNTLVVNNYSKDMYVTLNLGASTFEVGSNKSATCIIKNGAWCVTTG